MSSVGKSDAVLHAVSLSADIERSSGVHQHGVSLRASFTVQNCKGDLGVFFGRAALQIFLGAAFKTEILRGDRIGFDTIRP